MSSLETSSRAAGLTASVVTVVLLTACTVGPDFETPEATVSPSWYQEEREGLTSTGTEVVAWWEAFGDIQLNRLVEEAHRANNNLEIAAVRILESRAQLGIATGLRWPQSQTVGGTASYVSPSEASGPAEDFWSSDFGASVSWEIDFWGRYRRGIESANAALLATMASYDDVLVLLTAQVAQIYSTIRLTEEQLGIAYQNIEIQRRSYEIVEVLARRGEQSALDLQQAQTLLLGTEATVPGLEAALQQAKNALSTLLGRPPEISRTSWAKREPYPRSPTSLSSASRPTCCGDARTCEQPSSMPWPRTRKWGSPRPISTRASACSDSWASPPAGPESIQAISSAGTASIGMRVGPSFGPSSTMAGSGTTFASRMPGCSRP